MIKREFKKQKKMGLIGDLIPFYCPNNCFFNLRRRLSGVKTVSKAERARFKKWG
jgi:hypothetical protein